MSGGPSLPAGDPPPLIDPAEFPSWILHEDDRLLVVDKPALIVCHPSKRGPWSSLIGAAREYLGAERAHLVFRLDRETSGVVVLAKDADAAGRLQTAVERRRVGKTYLAFAQGEMAGPVEVDQPLGRDLASPVHVRQTATSGPGSQTALTRFEPLAVRGGFSFLRATPVTGRKHQIRAHAEWMGHRLVGDKLYGPDPLWYLRFIEGGWTPEMEAALTLRRQALHAWRIDLGEGLGGPASFTAPLPADLRRWASAHMALSSEELDAACAGR